MFEQLLKEAEEEGLEVISWSLQEKTKGLYCDGFIVLNKNIPTTSERACIIAEELGHHYTTAGNILDQKVISNRKQEIKAKRWAVKRMIQTKDFIKAFEAGITNKAELVEFLNITEKFLDIAIDHFRRIHGQYCEINGYIICFDPLWVFKKTDTQWGYCEAQEAPERIE
ncbi:MAG: ImmA/IrrE family metallo-endopeptidase [Caldicoprobacterales bacterium]|jgi:hypothetical protein